MSNNNDRIAINHFASRMFRDVADMDYISARTLYKNECFDEFLIFSQQAIEKYLKGILMFNRVKSRKMTHKLSVLLQKCSNDVAHFKISEQTRKFIKEIDGYDDLRYAKYMFGAFMAQRSHLVELDRAVMELRRYCHNDTPYAVALSKATDDQLIEITRKKGISFLYLLEKIVKNKNGKYSKLRSNLIWKNLYFSPRTKSISLTDGVWGKASGFSKKELAEMYDVIKEYIFIPKDVKDCFEKLR